jgi:hypothetical protein
MPALPPPSSSQKAIKDPLLSTVGGHIRAWCVIHACDCAREVIHLIDGQRAVGMKPYLLTAPETGSDGEVSGSPASLLKHGQSGSLLTAWNEVRDWRKALTHPDLSAFDVVHAHTFSAGMAAVRNCPAVVYDICSFVERRASGARSGEFTWLARSFRVAEQFIITRSGAVVVHSHNEQQGVLERGADEENVFQIPLPLENDWVELLRHKKTMLRERDDSSDGVSFFAPDVCLREQHAEKLPADAVQLLEAFAIVSAEVPGTRLFVQADAACVQLLFEQAKSLNIAGNVHAITSDDRQYVLAETDVIIAVPSEQTENAVVTGLLKRCAVLAADVPGARDASAEGCGLLWYRPGDLRDLAARAAFLAAHPDFRLALAESGRKHLLETRTPEAVACRYDWVYRHAWNRRRSGASPFTGLTLQVACL